MALLECPLCTFSVLPSDNYVLQLHFEQEHTEDSPFRIQDDPEPLPKPLPAKASSARSQHVDTDTPSDSEDENSVLCPEPNCGELVLLSDFNDHLDLHAAETLSFDEATGEYRTQQPTDIHKQQPLHDTTSNMGASKEPSFLEQGFHSALPTGPRRSGDDGRRLKKKLRARGNSSASEKSTLSRSIAAFNPFSRIKSKPVEHTARLGRAELGPHAWEERMPRWLHDQLKDGPKTTIVNRIGRDGRLIKQEVVQNESPGIIPILAQLSALDRSVKQAYYCHPSTLHIGKTPKEGGFCGYRNIQMLISYIQGAHAQGQEEFPGRTPGILQLQDLIERAWDKGINEIGRAQTGGIRDTRKYIGTPEAQALFLSSQIDCAVELFSDSPDGQIEAHEQLLYAMESYFSQAAVKDDGSGVIKTLLPPVYLQQPGHSVTVIGFERRRDGTCNLIVFDPMYHTSPAMQTLIGRKNIRTPRPEVLQAYRRNARQLRKHASFEALMLTAFPPLFPAWDVLRQFPDCRYVYAFFRSKTLGYDVYPEDHFLRNFPWQQYGGLWIVDDARFARAEKMNPLTAQALRRITGEGASAPATSFPTCSATLNMGPNPHSITQLSSNIQAMRSATSTRSPSLNLMSSMDGSMMPDSNPMGSVLNMIGMHNAQFQSNPRTKQPCLTVEVPQGPIVRAPGYPSPTSPSPGAKQLYPSPTSESDDQTTIRLSGSDILAGHTLTSRCSAHGYEQYMNPSGNGLLNPGDKNIPKRYDTTLGTSQNIEYVPQAKLGGVSIASPPRSASPSGMSPPSPSRQMSPRTAMLKNMVGKQALHSISHNPTLYPPTADASAVSTQPCSVHQFVLPAPNGYAQHGAAYLGSTITASRSPQPQSQARLCPSQAAYPSALPVPRVVPQSLSTSPSPPSIEIANGTETSIVSPLSPTGTMLRYTSHRPVDSGLLALRSLSEAQVAEYRFWRPCGRRICAFGCGGGQEGEVYAAKRLFRDVEDVVPEEDEGEIVTSGSEKTILSGETGSADSASPGGSGSEAEAEGGVGGRVTRMRGN